MPRSATRYCRGLKPRSERRTSRRYRSPSLTISRVVFAASVGYADSQKKLLATPDTPYRVGSVSKPFTALLLMIFVELGLIDLDVPVQKYLPEFQPKNKYDKKITLRQMLSHRSGLVREGPVGNYFDDSQPSIGDTVRSLNQTELVYEPGSTTSYSNMALSVVGHVLEKMQKEPFDKLMQRKLLDPIGMTESNFAITPKIREKLPKATMWTYWGREFPAPAFEFGILPAGNLYSSVNDMSKFLKFLFADGKGPHGPILKRESLEKMYTIQFPKKDKKFGFGLGFFVSEVEGKRVIRHGGAVYGFSTEFAGPCRTTSSASSSARRRMSPTPSRRASPTPLSSTCWRPRRASRCRSWKTQARSMPTLPSHSPPATRAGDKIAGVLPARWQALHLPASRRHEGRGPSDV